MILLRQTKKGVKTVEVNAELRDYEDAIVALTKRLIDEHPDQTNAFIYDMAPFFNGIYLEMKRRQPEPKHVKK